MEKEMQNGEITRKREETQESKEKRRKTRRKREQKIRRNLSPDSRERRLEKRREIYRKRRLQEIGISLSLARRKSTTNPPKQAEGPELCKECNVFIDDNNGINHSYCQSVTDSQFSSQVTKPIINKVPHKENQESKPGDASDKKEEQKIIDRKKMMDEILKQHYRETGKGSTKTVNLTKKVNEKPEMFSCEKCNFSCDTQTGLTEHNTRHHYQPKYFHFPNFLGFNCSLLGSNYQQEIYYVTEVSQPKKSELISLPDNLSETCYFFIPQKILQLYPGLKSWIDKKIPYDQNQKNCFNAHFPISTHPVTWAINLSVGERCVDQREMFIFTKSRFKLIQSIRSGKDQRSSGSYGVFCKFLDQDQAKIENFIRINTGPLFNSCAATEKESPKSQIELATFNCPFEDCKFISDRKFSGIRNHLLKHFKRKIEDGAKPRPMLSEREKSNCMSKTGCSVVNLKARGELVHHYGIFHCLVDDFFQDFAFSWIANKYFSHFMKNLCPYEDQTYKDESSFLEHLTVSHYFNSILAEIEDMVRFNLTYSEEKKALTNVYKCPFCKLKFFNLADGSNVRDVKEMVIHCGAEHGFALYYLMSDKNVEDMRELLVNQRIKSEPLDEEDLAIASVQKKTRQEVEVESPSKIKVEALEETEVDINNFVKAELDDSIKVKEEPDELLDDQ